jgi:predicted nucleotidyltransferase
VFEVQSLGHVEQLTFDVLIVGSTAYGLQQEGSDVDRRVFYLPPAELQWSIAGVPEQLESPDEEVYWEIEKFIRLALKSEP